MAQRSEPEGTFLSEILAVGVLLVGALAIRIAELINGSIDGLIGEITGGLVGLWVFIGYCGVVLYREYRLREVRKEAESEQQPPHEATKELENTEKIRMKPYSILGQIGKLVIAALLAAYVFFTPAIWFFCSAAEGQSCGVEVVFWPLSFL